MSDYKLQTVSASKTYRNGVDKLEVLKGINLGIKDKEFLAIQGPSGAGKSTLLHILGGLDNPSSGQVFFEGIDIYRLNDNERAAYRNSKIGFVFQFFHLLPELNAVENVLLPAMLKSWWGKSKAVNDAQSLLSRIGLSGRTQHRPNQLSGGEQQRVAIARALINKPQVLLCDEPTGNLDSDNGQKILGLLKELNRKEKVTVILVTHDKDIAAYADRIVSLKDGVLVN